MRRYKSVVRILFILSVVHLALAAPAVGRPGHQDVAEDVTAAPEKRAPGFDDDADSISSGSSGSSGSSSTSSLDSLNLPHPGSVVSFNFGGHDSEEELASSPEREPEPVSDSSRHLAEPTDSGSDRYYSASEDPGDLSHDLTTPVSESTSSHSSAGPSTRDDTKPDPADPEEKAPLLDHTAQSDDPESVSPPLKQEIVPVSVHPEPYEVNPDPWAPVTAPEPEAKGTAPGSASPSSESFSSTVAKAASKEAPEAEKFFNKELMQKIKDYSILGSVAGIAGGVITSIQKEVMGVVTPGAYVSALFPPSPANIYPSNKHSDL